MIVLVYCILLTLSGFSQGFSQKASENKENALDDIIAETKDEVFLVSSDLATPHLVDGSGGHVLEDPDLTANFTSKILFTECFDWLPVNHIYFQLANTFLLLSYLAPAGIYGLIYLRVTLAVGSALFALWGWVILCAFDTFIWNALFVVINVVHVVVLLCSMRPVRFDKHVEEVYESMFKPLKVSKHQFKKVVNCIKTIRPLKRGDLFAKEKHTKVESLSLILSGRLAVSQEGRRLHVLTPMQFVDSPEWFGVSSDEYFQVTIEALEDCRLMQWHRDKLKLTLLSDAFLQSVFDHVLGRDVVRKLTQAEDRLPVEDSSEVTSEKPLKNSPSKSKVHEHAAAVPEQALLLNESLSKKEISASRTSLHSRHSARHSTYDFSKMDELNSTDI